MWTTNFVFGFSFFGFSLCAKYPYTGNGESREFWMSSGGAEIRKARMSKPNIAVAKNVIFFLGDGMGVSTVTAARILKGQLDGGLGEESSLSFESFPHVGLSKTYNQDAQTADSAGTATAFLSGVKTNLGILGLDGRSRRNDCSSQSGTEVETMLDWARAKDKTVGVVTNTRITHATPGALYAKTPERNWESDTDMAEDNVVGPCKDIASQLIDNNSDIRVILGGGRTKFLRKSDIDPESGSNSSSARSDGRNLIEDWKRKQAELNHAHRYVWNASEFKAVDPTKTDYLLGLFSESHLEFALDRASDVGGEPTLAEMTEKAIQILSKNSNGFFLEVEGGRIDHAHHLNMAKKSLHEVLDFSEAVKKAMDMTNEKDTLIIVTADHSHVFTIGGYPTRGNPIFGLTDDREGGMQIANDGKPYTTLMYANGNSSFSNPSEAPRPDPSSEVLDHKEYKQQAGIPLDSETHGGEDVAIYARGPMSHLIHGIHEQSYIAHVMAYASCMGAYSNGNVCALADVEEEQQRTSLGVPVQINAFVFLVMLFFFL